MDRNRLVEVMDIVLRDSMTIPRDVHITFVEDSNGTKVVITRNFERTEVKISQRDAFSLWSSDTVIASEAARRTFDLIKNALRTFLSPWKWLQEYLPDTDEATYYGVVV